MQAVLIMVIKNPILNQGIYPKNFTGKIISSYLAKKKKSFFYNTQNHIILLTIYFSNYFQATILKDPHKTFYPNTTQINS